MATLSRLDPNSNISSHYADLVASPNDRAAAVLTCVTAIGAHLGRRSALLYNGHEIYPTLYSLIVTQVSILADWYRWFHGLKDSPPITKSGISKAESLVYLVRDPVLRPDKIFTSPNEDPEWRVATVDGGADEKRRLIMQRLGPQLASKRSAPAKRLLEALNAAYHDGEVSAFVSYRDGGFHGTKAAHIGLLMPEPDDGIAAAVWEQMPVLLARAEGPVLYREEVSAVISDINAAINNSPSRVTIAPEAAPIIEEARATSERPYAVLTLLRVAHILSVLACSPVVTEPLLLQARAIVETSESTIDLLCKSNRASLGDQILEFVRANDGTCARHQIVRHFRRQGTREEICAQLTQLEVAQQLIPTRVQTAGRRREEWRLPQVS